MSDFVHAPTFSHMLPPDKADAIRIYDVAKAALEALNAAEVADLPAANEQLAQCLSAPLASIGLTWERARLVVTLAPDAWKSFRAQTRRPYRSDPSEVHLPHLPHGKVVFVRGRE